MRTLRMAFVASTACIAVSAAVLFGQAAPPAGQQPPAGPPLAGPGGPPPGAPGRGRGPQQPMSFFVTSAGLGRGGDLGGLAGADARGQVIAATVAELHGDTLEQARIGNFIGIANSIDEKGNPVPNSFPGSEHDILTGSTIEGRAYSDNTRDHTCNNWTSGVGGAPPNPSPVAGAGPGAPPAAGAAPGRGAPGPGPAPGTPSARVGHADKGNIVPSWNSSHSSNGCSQMNFNQIGGAGRLYCFAVN